MKKIRLEDVETVTCQVQLFNKHLYNVRNGRAYRVIKDYWDKADGSEQEIFELELAKIFPQIKLVWAKQQIVAKWDGTMLCPCKNQSFFRFDNGHKRFLLRARQAYAQLEKQEQQALQENDKTTIERLKVALY